MHPKIRVPNMKKLHPIDFAMILMKSFHMQNKDVANLVRQMSTKKQTLAFWGFGGGVYFYITNMSWRK